MHMAYCIVLSTNACLQLPLVVCVLTDVWTAGACLLSLSVMLQAASDLRGIV